MFNLYFRNNNGNTKVFLDIITLEKKTGFDLTLLKDHQQEVLNNTLLDSKIGDYPLASGETFSLVDPILGKVACQ